MSVAPTCPRCGARRILAPDCPACGVIYARAEAARELSAERSVRPEILPPPTPDLDAQEGLDRWEQQVRRYALPAGLLVGWLFTAADAGRFVSRLISGMWLHELGHASAAWLCGHAAVPLPWFTSIPQSRSAVVPLLFGGGCAALAYLAHRHGWPLRRALFAALAAAFLLGAVLVPRAAAQLFITFWGDGGAMVFGAALCLTVFAAPGSKLHRGGLRWGLLFLGSVGFWDAFRTWWTARKDPSEIPFGLIHGVGLSDASKLVDVHGWSERGLANAYVTLGILCLVGLCAGWAFFFLRAAKR